MCDRAIFYAQDPGGTSYLLPLLSRLLPRAGARVVARPLSEELLRRERIPFEPFTEPPIESGLRAWLKREGVSHVVCTLSAQRDLTNALLVSACAAEGVPSFGIMDHWKNFTRLLDKHGSPRFAPDYIGCIDSHARSRLARLLGGRWHLRVLGHPQFERLLDKRHRRRCDGPPRVLVVSQPVARGGNWRSVFEPDSWRLLEALAHAASNAGATIAFRPHPKEDQAGPLPEGVAWDPSGSSGEALGWYDVFVGVDSMLLVEASVAGKHCVSLMLSDVAGNLEEPLPYRLGEVVYRLDEMGSILTRVVARAGCGPANPPAQLANTVRGSLERGVRCIEEFLAHGAVASR